MDGCGRERTRTVLVHTVGVVENATDAYPHWTEDVLVLYNAVEYETLRTLSVQVLVVLVITKLSMQCAMRRIVVPSETSRRSLRAEK